MKLGLPQVAMLSVYWHLRPVVAGSLSVKERAAPRPRASMTIRALDQQWALENCDFASSKDMPCKDVVLVGRSYSGVEFQKSLAADDKGCSGACTLLLEQKEKVSRLRSSVDGSCFYNRKFYSKYKYEQNEPESREEPSGAKTEDGVLRIPRSVRLSASTHRLAIVNILESKDEKGTLCHCLQLSYEDVPSQCKSSVLFKSSQAEILKAREVLYGSCGLDHLPVKKPGDSDGDANIVKLAVATVLAEHLGQGVCAQVGRGGYLTSHEGMVHAFLVLTPESCKLVKKFMDENALGIGEKKDFVRSGSKRPDCHSAFLGFLNSSRDSSYVVMSAHTYQAVVSNYREELMCTSCDRLGNEMMLLPTHGGAMTIGTLYHRYCIRHFGKHTKNTIHVYSSETLISRRRETFRGAYAGCRCF